MPLPPDLLGTFRRLFLAHAPPYQAWMQPADAAAKYRKKFHPISDAELAAHLAGRLTLAAPLSGPDDHAAAAALDLDAGGADALGAVLGVAHERSLTAFALTSSHARHNGGHVWLLFDTPAAPSRLRRLADEFVRDVGVAAETYPSGRMLRLPLGVHRGSGQRGRLLLQDGTALDLDAGAAAITTALTVLDALPRNTTAALPLIPALPSEAAPQTRQAGAGAAKRTESTIVAYNAATDLLGLLMGYGGRSAAHHRNGTVVLHCPCGHHRNGDAHASLELQPARAARYGRYVAVGYAPRCAWSLERRVVIDAFAVYCHMEQLQPADAVRALRGHVGSVAPPAWPASPAADAATQADVFGANGGTQ